MSSKRVVTDALREHLRKIGIIGARKGGLAAAAKRTPIPAETRFWKMVSKTDGCWLWQGSKDGRGYGLFKPDGKTTIVASRYSYQITYGPIPENLHVCHRCDNPPCVNPEHLFAGTQKENVQDAWRKGRGKTPHLAGEFNPRAKLSNGQVSDIKRLCATGEQQKVVAQKYNISRALVCMIVNGQRWQERARK